MNEHLRARPTPLPAKSDNWQRKIKSARTLNDHVEDVHLSLWDDNPEYRQFLEAVWDSDAIEGSLSIDNTMAAIMLRDKAKNIEGNPVDKKKLDTIVKSLGIVLRRYEFSRRERRHTVEGIKMPAPADGNGFE